jgi:hypothetical protein
MPRLSVEWNIAIAVREEVLESLHLELVDFFASCILK